jgi:acetyl-CoA C-acetyltransferase
MRKVSILGIGETVMGNLPQAGIRDLIKEAGEKAIADSQVGKSGIQALYLGNFNSSYLCQQSLINGLAVEALELGEIPSVRIEAACASGGLAFRQAFLSIAAGFYDCVMVGGVEKMTHADTATVTTAIASAEDYNLEFTKGVTFPGIFAMIANRYMSEYRLGREQLAAIPVQSHANAVKNPDAQMRKEITVDKVINGVKVADPLTVFDCSLVTDGAAFAVLCATEKISEISPKNNKIVDVIGSGHGGSFLTIANKTLTTFSATRNAAKEAYAMAGLKPQDIDLAECHDCFSITQAINSEDLGFFAPGQGGFAASEGKTAIGGQIPINTSGGLKAKGHPIGATGISMIYEIVTQLRGDAGERQVKNAEIGLTHNLGGAAVACAVHIFQRKT